MDQQLAKQLEELREQVSCKNKYRCLKDVFFNSCAHKCYALSDTMPCYSDCSEDCTDKNSFASAYICKCPLRKFIAINIGEISDAFRVGD